MNPGAETLTVNLSRQDKSQSWGFRLHGGADFPVPLSIQSVVPGGLAEQHGIKAGDNVLSINQHPSDSLTHEAATQMIIQSGNNIQLLVQRGQVSIWRPQVTNIAPATPNYNTDDIVIQKTSLAAKPQEFLNIGAAHNRSARPFGASQPAPDQMGLAQSMEQPQPSVNQPGAYGADSSAGGMYQNPTPAMTNTNGFQANNSGPASSFGHHNTTAAGFGQNSATSSTGRPAGIRSVKAPVTNLNTEKKSAQYMTCKYCGTLIVGVFVKIQGEPIHPECFKCCECGMNLKNKGHFTLNNRLYCEVHIREAGTADGMQPIPIAR